MKEGWKNSTLGELCEIYQPTTIATSDLICTGKYKVYGANGIIGRYNKYNHEDSEVLMCCRGATCGAINISEPYSWINGNAMVVRPKTSELGKEFLVYLLKTLDYSRIITGAAQPQITRKSLAPTSVEIPPLSSQQEIVTYLDTAFEKIDRLKENAEKSLSDAKALFQSALKEMMQPKEGWEEKTLSDICRVINGRAYLKPEMLKEGKYKILRVGNFFTNESWYYSDLELEEDKYCEDGDLLYAWSASFGPRIWRGEKVIYHYHIWKMICSNEIDKYFMYYWLDSDELKKQAMTNLHGATMNHITKNIMEHCIVAFPDKDTQHSIVTTLDALSEKVSALEANYTKTIAECNALKQALLKQVFE